METPLPSRRITRSQAAILSIKSNNNTIPKTSTAKNEDSDDCILKSRNKERERSSSLIDITNGSPIVGLAMERLKTPSSRCSKKKMMISNNESKNTMTPGSGESLLRGQVKTLLQKVVEEDNVIPKICFKQFVKSLTPANTQQVHVYSTCSNNGLNPFTFLPGAENLNFSQMLNEVVSAPNQNEKGENVEKNVITRSLFSDFSENLQDSESSVCNSLLTCQDSNASVWSVQVNASTSDEYKEYEGYEDVVVDDLCEGISKISVNNAVKFTGKHTRFVYNSDEELEGILSSSSSPKTE